MGIGIAQVASQVASMKVLIMDSNPESLKKHISAMEHRMNTQVQKGKLDEKIKEETLSRIIPVTNLNDLKDCNFIIEAVTENIQVKQNIFKQISEIVDKNTILASNTSSISITKLASVTKHPQNFIGMHFMNPVPVMTLVEIIRGLATSEDTLNKTIELSKKMGKITTTSQDRPGFIANRILIPYLNEAIFSLQENLASIEDIDTTMKYGLNLPMGPLRLADFIGLDTVLNISRILHSELGDKYRPSPLLVNYVDAGYLGVKSGKGFYDYSKK